MDPDKPQYVPAVGFYRSTGIHFEAAARLVKAGVLIPDAYLNQKPIFLADGATVERAKATIALYRLRQANRLANAKELVNS